MKFLRVVIRVPTSTHSKGVLRVISTEKIQSNLRVVVQSVEDKTSKKHRLFLQMLPNKANCRKKVFNDAIQAPIPVLRVA